MPPDAHPTLKAKMPERIVGGEHWDVKEGVRGCARGLGNSGEDTRLGGSIVNEQRENHCEQENGL